MGLTGEPGLDTGLPAGVIVGDAVLRLMLIGEVRFRSLGGESRMSASLDAANAT